MNHIKSQEKPRRKAPTLHNSHFAEHVGTGISIITTPRAIGRILLAAAAVGAGGYLIDVGASKADKLAASAYGLIANDRPSFAQREAALKSVTYQSSQAVEIEPGANMHDTAEPNEGTDVPGGGQDNVIGQLNEAIIIPKPMENTSGWVVTKLPKNDLKQYKLSGDNTLNGNDAVWFDINPLENQGYAHEIPQKGIPTEQLVEVNNNGTVSVLGANESHLPDPGAGLSYEAPHQNHS